MTTTVVLLIHVFLAVALIGLILIQHGKGADAGAAFGSGASSTVFGAQGSANFLSRATKWLALAFFITSGVLAYMSRGTEGASQSVMDSEVIEAPADPAAVGRDQESEIPAADEAPAEEAASGDEAGEKAGDDEGQQ